MSRVELDNEALDKVVGGFMQFNYNTQILKYTHEETKEVTYYKIKDFMNAWKTSNDLHGQNYHEDTIIAKLKSEGYIE